MHTDTCDVAVLGLGGVGASAFCSLAARGTSVIGIDRFESIHEMGSSHGQSRVFRVAYFEHPDYVPLAQFSREQWVELDARAPNRIFVPAGGAWIGPESGPHVSESRLAAEQHGLEFEMLSADEAMSRWPALRIPHEQVCFHEPAAGLICPEHAIEAFLREGTMHGGRVMRGRTVESIEQNDDGILVRMQDGVVKAGRIVMALGPWMPAYTTDLKIRLEPQRQLLGWTRPADPELVREGRLPVWLFADNDESIQYGFPICSDLPGPGGFKLARHCDGDSCDPDLIRRDTNESDANLVLERLDERIPAGFGPLTTLKTCIYTMSDDGHFIVDKHPENDRIILACGLSGHGFKFCPALGQALSDLALEAGTDIPIGFLGLGRFKDQDNAEK